MAEWKNEFIMLYLSDNINDFNQAFELKQQNMPIKLYRYRSVQTQMHLKRLLKSISEGCLYCSRADDLNDPFELRSTLSSEKSSSYLGNRENIKSSYFENLKKHFDEVEFTNAMSGEDWFNQIMQLVSEKAALDSNASPEELFNIFEKALMHQVEDLNTAWNSILGMSRIASFSEKHDNLPMWQHYADGHRGVCLEFDTQKLNNFYSNNLFPVYYTDKLPDAVQSGFETVAKKEKPPFGLATSYCIQKLDDWSYEREWRFVLQPGMLYPSFEDTPADYWNGGMEIDFIKPSKIILGNNVGQDMHSEICLVAHEQSIPVTKMEITQYGLKEQPTDVSCEFSK